MITKRELNKLSVGDRIFVSGKIFIDQINVRAIVLYVAPNRSNIKFKVTKGIKTGLAYWTSPKYIIAVM